MSTQPGYLPVHSESVLTYGRGMPAAFASLGFGNADGHLPHADAFPIAGRAKVRPHRDGHDSELSASLQAAGIADVDDSALARALYSSDASLYRAIAAVQVVQSMPATGCRCRRQTPAVG